MAKEDKPQEDSLKREEPARAKRGVSDDDATAEFPASEDASVDTNGDTPRKKKED